MNTGHFFEEISTLDIRNISELGMDIIQLYFYGISIKEVLKLRRVNTRFNEACKGESFWRNKVLFDYGVEKIYGESWKDTAKLLYNSNMINLRKKWIDGRTYGKLLEEVLRNHDEFFAKISAKYNLSRHESIIVPREFAVISFTVRRIRKYCNLETPMEKSKGDKLNKLKIANHIKSLIDPIPYIIIYCLDFEDTHYSQNL